MNNCQFIHKTIHFKEEQVSYICPTWDDMNALSFKIAKQIQKDKLKFDRIVTLAKGGWPLTRSLVDFLQINKVASIGVKFYDGVNSRLDKPSIYQEIPISIKNEKILLFDDVADTGNSLKYVSEHLTKKNVGKITTATLFYKPCSIIKPNYYGGKTSSWIIFPYDTVEMINVLGKKWSKIGFDKQKIRQRFFKLGFSEDLVNYYY